MKNLTSSNKPPEIDIFAPKAETAWNVLYDRYANRISAAEFDYLYARFILGMTSPSYAEREPSAHFDICRALISLKLPPERAHAGLHTVPEPTEPWVEDAYETIERQGAKIGMAIAEQKRTGEVLQPQRQTPARRPAQ